MATDTNTTPTLPQFCDDLDAHARRCWALSAAISGLARFSVSGGDPMFDGVDQLVQDICQEAQKLSEDMQILSGSADAAKQMKQDAEKQ